MCHVTLYPSPGNKPPSSTFWRGPFFPFSSKPPQPPAACNRVQVRLLPAAEGTGLIAGGAVRTVLELAGVRNAFGKQVGCNNALNNAKATVAGLASMRDVHQIAELRGVSVDKVLGREPSGKGPSSKELAAEGDSSTEPSCSRETSSGQEATARS